MEKVNEIIKNAVSRRTFLAGAGTVAAVTLVAGCSSSGSPALATPPVVPTAPTFNDTDILNFALNLEYLEAEFYLRAATGSGLSTTDAGGSGAGAVTGGAKIAGLTAQQAQYINEISQDELNHVRFLRQALAGAAVARPAIDLTNSFKGLATVAGLPTTFNPFADFRQFLVGAFVFEDVGVTAYNGAAGLLSATYLGPAASILAVEAYHAGEIRALLIADSILNGKSATATGVTTFTPDSTYVGYADKVSVVRASLGGGKETTLAPIAPYTVPLKSTPGPLSITNADQTNSIAFARNTDEVLHIVYATGGADGVTKGGFFPNGLNGNIKQTYS